MSELCTDNRFELIEKYKAKLIEATNIETDTLDMAAIDSILFRFWQMGWLDKLDADAIDVTLVKHGKWVYPAAANCYRCSVCEEYTTMEIPRVLYHYCPNCGSTMDRGKDDE